MGLFSRTSRSEVTVEPTADDVLLFQAMLLIAGADGSIDEEELVALETFFLTLPEFRGKSFRDVSEQALRAVSSYTQPHQAVELLAGLSTARLKEKCFLLAADIALSSGGLQEQEEALLSSMRAVLGVSDEQASKILEVLGIKYASG